ncbi:MAG TPA: fused MFS/spermidine synthase [Verrucomicrobiae bacterium]|nr:fused MFS/spermidine synthase [Verrucomicrobiae bacterium]
MLLYALTIFLSAFLLFAVQPIIAKMILPWFGGTSAVWSTCLLFFQVVLLLGYGYAHWLHQTWKARRQYAIHAIVLLASLAALPIVPNSRWRTVAGGMPSFRILALLALTVGLPYFLLSSTSPLLQAWYARSHRSGMPYRLFALSNLASMLALISYPLLIEPNLSSRQQAWIWSGAYVAFAICCALTARQSAKGSTGGDSAARDESSKAEPSPALMIRLLWLLLAATSSTLLLAVTNHLTQDVAAIPFLWILPLAVYLLSFILCFESPRLYFRPVFLPLLTVALAFLAYEIWPTRYDLYLPHTVIPLWPFVNHAMRPAIALTTAALFICCMVCHGEIVRLKPHPRFLTGFYVTLSLGGAVGGLFVGLVAPNLFKAYYEFPIGLAVCAAAAFWTVAREIRRGAIWQRLPAAAVLGVLLCGYIWFIAIIMRGMVSGYLVVERNFYGQLRVMNDGDPRRNPDAWRILVHGTINHGAQSYNPEYRRLPVTYFCSESGIGRAFQALPAGPHRIGMLGLGIGTVAAYGRDGDTLRIYEINPQVLGLARTQFSYLRDTRAIVEVALGDGRLSLENEPSQNFDILIMDAFSGDSVPVHLITREALTTYFRHLKPGGILAINITNRYLNLKPVIERGAAAFGKVAYAYAFQPEVDDYLCYGCDWALIMDRSTIDRHPELRMNADPLDPNPAFRAWTDDFSNMFQILN